MIKFFSKLISILMLCFVITGCLPFFNTSDGVADSDTLRVGTNVGYPPYIYSDEQGNVAGFDVDLMYEIAKIIGKKIIWVDMGFDALTISLQQGKVDLLIGGLSISEEKCKVIDMIQYTNPQPLVLYFWDSIPEGIQTIEDLKKLEHPIIALQTGSVGYEKYLTEFPFITLKTLDQYAEVIMDLKAGKSLAGCCDLIAATYLQKKVPELKLLPLPGTEKLWNGDGIGVNKKNKELFKALDGAIKTLQQNGTIQQLQAHWFSKEAI